MEPGRGWPGAGNPGGRDCGTIMAGWEAGGTSPCWGSDMGTPIWAAYADMDVIGVGAAEATGWTSGAGGGPTGPYVGWLSPAGGGTISGGISGPSTTCGGGSAACTVAVGGVVTMDMSGGGAAVAGLGRDASCSSTRHTAASMAALALSLPSDFLSPDIEPLSPSSFLFLLTKDTTNTSHKKDSILFENE